MGPSPERLDDRGFEQYRLAVEMADRLSARRGTANSFFLAVNAAVSTAVGFIFAGTSRAGDDAIGFSIAALGGLALTGAWWLSLRSYRDLSQAKWKVITDLEARLSIAPFADEWAFLKKDPVKGWRGRYAELGQVETVVPLIFAVIYGISLLKRWWP